jgi:hypothetical protein
MRRVLSAALATLSGIFFFAAPASAKFPTTKEFIANCGTDIDYCRQIIGRIIDVSGDNGSLYCAPADMTQPTDEEVEGVVGWLKSHPNVELGDTVLAIGVALRNLYPCPDK